MSVIRSAVFMDGLRRKIRQIALIAALCLFAAIFSGCVPQPKTETIICNFDFNSPYIDALHDIFPDYQIELGENDPYNNLYSAVAVEAFDFQAMSALESGIAEYWYPQFLTSVVIAIDRDRSDVEITGWRDLADCDEPVAVFDAGRNEGVIMAAMCFGLEGENYTLTEATKLLAALEARGRLEYDLDVPAIQICFDHRVAGLIAAGRNMEIIIPVEGTLSFEKGLLSNCELVFNEDVSSKLLAAGLRLPDQQSDKNLYPNESEYQRAKRVADTEWLMNFSLDVTRVMRREVLHSRLYSSADMREHQFFVLIFISILVIWAASVIFRAMQKGVQYAAFFTALILVSWMILRLIKYQMNASIGWEQALWYGYYVFQLSLPLVLLWMAWATDKPAKTAGPPMWLKVFGAANGILMLIVFTNSLHGWVFKLDFANPEWSSDYGYGIAFYIVLTMCAMLSVTAIGMLLIKNRRNPRKYGIIFPLLFCVLLVAYCVGYLRRVPFAWDSDVAMVVGVFTMLFFESAIRAGLIPVNTKYKRLFELSPLRIQILDRRGHLALSAAQAQPLDSEIIATVLKNSPVPYRSNEDSLVLANPILGGYALWYEDIGALNRLHKETQEAVAQLKASNALLGEEEKIRLALDAEHAKIQLWTQLESSIAGQVARLSKMIDKFSSASDKPGETARIAILLCYIKRRCNLFFREKETTELSIGELVMYINEIAGLTEYASVKIAAVDTTQGLFSTRRATLIYDFFYEVAEWATRVKCSVLPVFLDWYDGNVCLRVLSAEDIHSFTPGNELMQEIISAGGVIAIKNLDDDFGLSLSFPEGGGDF